MSHASTVAVVVAGGSGRRFGRSGGKQLLEIAGRPVLAWTVEALASCSAVDALVVVCPDERLGEYREAVVAAAGGLRVTFAPSGDTRQDSVASGLASVGAEVGTIVVHDGARPLVRAADLSRALIALEADEDADGVVLGHPATDTLKIVDGDVIAQTPDRSLYWAVQTPQVFRMASLRAAFKAAQSQGFVGTDDASVVEWNGGRVLVVEGARDNIKVTVPEDALIAEALIRARREEDAS